MAEQQAALAADGMHAHHGMLGFIDGRGKDVAVLGDPLARGVVVGRRLQDRGVIVEIGVRRPQIVDELAQHLGQTFIGGLTVRPLRIPARLGDGERAQDRCPGIGIDEGHVGVPARRGIAFAAVELEQVARPFGYRHRRVRDGIAEQGSEILMLPVGQMLLVAEEQHLVPHERRLDGLHRRGGQVARQLDAVHDRADRAGHRGDVEVDALVARIGIAVMKVRHCQSPWVAGWQACSFGEGVVRRSRIELSANFGVRRLVEQEARDGAAAASGTATAEKRAAGRRGTTRRSSQLRPERGADRARFTDQRGDNPGNLRATMSGNNPCRTGCAPRSTGQTARHRCWKPIRALAIP